MIDDPKLPPDSPPSQGHRAKVIDLAHAVATRATAPVLDIVKRRMYRDWIRGATPRALRLVYGNRRQVLRVSEVDAILREQARQAQRRAA